MQSCCTGNVADFVILDRDLLRPSPEEILQTRVLRTVWAAK
jgi:predicted amidohydrolase YtcJ